MMSYNTLPAQAGCPGCSCWGNAMSKEPRVCAYCELIRPAAKMFGWSVVRIIVYSATKVTPHNRQVRNLARVRGVKPHEIVDAILAVLDTYQFDERRERLDAKRVASLSAMRERFMLKNMIKRGYKQQGQG